MTEAPLRVLPICVPSNLFKKRPTNAFDLDLEKPIAVKQYRLLRFLIDMFFDAEQGSSVGSVFVGDRSQFQCTLLLEFLRKSPVGALDDTQNPFPLFFPPSMDQYSATNKCVRERGSSWWLEEEIQSIDACEVFAGRVKNGEVDMQAPDQCYEYIIKRITSPNFFHRFHQDDVDVNNLLEDENFAGIRFWFFVNDGKMSDFDDILWPTFKKNIIVTLQRVFSDKRMSRYNNPTLKRVMGYTRPSKKPDTKIFERETLPRMCRDAMNQYEKTCKVPLYDLDDSHHCIFTPKAFADLINVVIPLDGKIPFDAKTNCSHVSFGAKQSLDVTVLRDIGITLPHLKDCIIDPTQRCVANYANVPSSAMPLMTKKSYLFFNAKHSLHDIERAELPWNNVDCFFDLCHERIGHTNNDAPPPTKKCKSNPFFVDEIFFVERDEECGFSSQISARELDIESNKGALEEICDKMGKARSLYVQFMERYPLDPKKTRGMKDAYERHAMAVWYASFTPGNPKMCAHNLALMEWHKEGHLPQIIPPMCPLLKPISNRYVRFPYDQRMLNGVYNQYILAFNMVNCAYDVLTCPERDEVLFQGKLKNSILGFGPPGCGKSYTSDKIMGTVIKGTIKPRGKESTDSPFTFKGGDSNKETKLFDESPVKISCSGKAIKNEQTEQKSSDLLQQLSAQRITKETTKGDPVSGKRTKVVYDISCRINCVVFSNRINIDEALRDRMSVLYPSTNENTLFTKNDMNVKPSETVMRDFLIRERTLQWWVSMSIQMISSGVVSCDAETSLADHYLNHFIRHFSDVFPKCKSLSRKIKRLRRKLWIRTVLDATVMAFFSPCGDFFPRKDCPFRSIQQRLPYFLFSTEEAIIQEICDSIFVFMCPSQWSMINMIAQKYFNFSHRHPGISRLDFDLRDSDVGDVVEIINKCQGKWASASQDTLMSRLETLRDGEMSESIAAKDQRAVGEYIQHKMSDFLHSRSFNHTKYTCEGQDPLSYQKCADEGKNYTSHGTNIPHVHYRETTLRGVIWRDPNCLEAIGHNEQKIIQKVLGGLVSPIDEFHNHVTMKQMFKDLKQVVVRFKPRPLFTSDGKSCQPDALYPIDKNGFTIMNAVSFVVRGKSTSFRICTHFLTLGDPKDILSEWLDGLRTPHTRERSIPLGFQQFSVDGLPELCKMHVMKPILPGQTTIGQREHIKLPSEFTQQDMELKYAKDHHSKHILNADICEKVITYMYSPPEEKETSRKYPSMYIKENLAKVACMPPSSGAPTFLPRVGDNGVPLPGISSPR